MLWDVSVAIADSAVGRREVCFSFSELLIKLLGEKEITLKKGEEPWLSRMQFKLADSFLYNF